MNSCEPQREELRRLLARLTSAGRTPTAIYGAGKLTAAMRPRSLCAPGVLAGVIEDDPQRRERTWSGLPVLSREAALARGVRSIVIVSASRDAQMAMSARLAQAARDGVSVAFCPDLGLAPLGPPLDAPTGLAPALDQGELNVNLGGGWAWCEPGWLNLDSAMGYDLGVQGLEGFGPGTVARIYSSHALEHLEMHRARALLRDCRTALRTGGVLRLVVPDCEAFVRAWREGDESFLRGNPGLTQHFETLRECVIEMGGNPTDFDKPSRIDHRFFYDRWTLTWLLMLCGFERVHEAGFRQSLDAVMTRPAELSSEGYLVGGFDHPSYKPISLYLEAVG